MSTLKDEHFAIIIKHVRRLCPNKRKPKYSDEYYLHNILSLLNEFVSWRALKKSIKYKKGLLANKSEDEISKDNHFKTICAKHLLWSRKLVYKEAYTEIMKNKVDAEGDHLQLIIDGTNIINKTGVEAVGYGSETRKKKFTKLTVLSNNSADLIAVIAHQTNDKSITNKAGKTITIKTLEHDTKGIIPVIESIETKKTVTLVGDAGYILNDKTKDEYKKEHNLTIITPYRRNQNKTNTDVEKAALKTRYKVENSIGKLKKFNRIHVRRDKFLCAYMSFVYLGFISVS